MASKGKKVSRKKATKKKTRKRVETLTHEEASRKNIPTAEYQSVLHKEEQDPVRVAYDRRNRDLADGTNSFRYLGPLLIKPITVTMTNTKAANEPRVVRRRIRPCLLVLDHV